MRKFDFVICGNNIGALVSAIVLGKKYKVALINPYQNWGAHFAGIDINGETFDVGMNFFEFTSFHKSSADLMSYDPAIRNDSARFFNLVEGFIASRIEYTEVEDINVLIDGTFAKDIVMANSFEILQKLPKETIKKIRNEIQLIIKNGDKSLHTSQKKNKEELFLNKSLFEVSISNHGKTFHDLFIESFCKKIFNMSSKDCPALLHRIAWVPLFYPETLLKALNGEKDLAPTLFHYPKKGYFSAFTDVLISEIRGNENIVIFNEKINSLKNNTHYDIEINSESISANQVIWCLDLFSLIQTSKENLLEYSPKKASVTIAFCFVERSTLLKEFSSLYVCENSNPIYRITNQEFSAKKNDSQTIKLVIEFNLDVLIEFEMDNVNKIIELINEFLVENNITSSPIKSESITIKEFRNAVNLPTLCNFKSFEKLYKTSKNIFPEIELLGPASGFVSTSFNDQIVQALKIEKKYN